MKTDNLPNPVPRPGPSTGRPRTARTMNLVVVAILSSSRLLTGQSLIDSNSFFDPDFKIRREGIIGETLALTVTNAPVSGGQASGSNAWSHSAGGHVQVRTELSPAGIPLANLDAQLAAYTRTTGNSLVFGREITTDVELLGIVNPGPALQGLVNQVAGASILYNWNSSATIDGLVIVPDQLYRVNFTVTSGDNLPVDLLDSATFGINTAGISGASNQSAQLLNLLDIISVGNNSSTGNFSFDFKSGQNLSSLDFNFAATTAVGVSLLGGTAGNQNVLTFSGFQVVAIPEPGTMAIFSMAGIAFALRRRRIRVEENLNPSAT